MSTASQGPACATPTGVLARLRIWHFGFAAVLAVALVIVVIEDGSNAHRLSGVGLVALLAGAYALFGRPALEGEETIASFARYVVPALVIIATMLYVSPVFFVLLWVLYPQLFAMAPTIRTAIVGSVVLSAIWAVAVARWADPHYSSNGWQAGVLQAVIGLAFSLAMGWWITRVVEESAQRAELIGELQRTRAGLAAAHHEAGVFVERERFAAEIHDTLAQGFASIVMLLQAAEGELARDSDAAGRHIALAQRTARENLAEARALVADSLPVPLQMATLRDAITRMTERFGEDHDVRVEVVVRGEPRGLRPTEEVALLRAAQEALTNAGKHAMATRVVATLHYAEDATLLVVSDDGRGFDAAAPTTGFGLRGMRARLQQVGGSADVHSTPGAGTTLTMSVP